MSDAMERVAHVIVVGSGPAGLAAAIALKRAGVPRVIVLERHTEAGGTPRHCNHPPFGIREYARVLTGPAYARRNVSRAIANGVEIRTRVSVTALHPAGRVSVATTEGPAELGADRVVLATGLRETPRSARLVSGSRALGICNTGTLQDLVYGKNRVPFRNPVIVGSELVSFSSLFTCWRAGIRPVAMIEPDKSPWVRWPLALAARLFGIRLRLNTKIDRIIGQGRVRAVNVVDENGAAQKIACDGVLFTGKFTPEAELVRMSHLALDPGTGGPAIDQHGQCSDPSFLACGNALRPVETAGWCWREGWRTGAWIAESLGRPEVPGRACVDIKCVAPVRYVVPQRLCAGAEPECNIRLQLSVDAPVDGVLQINDARGLVLAKKVSARPGRRFHVRLPSSVGSRQAGPVTVRLRKT